MQAAWCLAVGPLSCCGPLVCSEFLSFCLYSILFTETQRKLELKDKYICSSVWVLESCLKSATICNVESYLKKWYLKSNFSETYILKKKRPYSYSILNGRIIGLPLFLLLVKIRCKDLFRLKASTDFLKLHHTVGESPTLMHHYSSFIPAPRTCQAPWKAARIPRWTRHCPFLQGAHSLVKQTFVYQRFSFTNYVP